VAILKEYLNKKYDTPQNLKDKYNGSEILIVGTGNSTIDLVKYKDRLKDKFGVVIGLNYSTKDFESVMDFRLIVEKKADGFLKDLDGREYRRDLPHIINWKSIDKYPRDLPLYKTTRSNFNFNPRIREYGYNGSEGLLIGPPDTTGLSAGTAACQALHLACIMGAKSVYLIGCDLMFKAGGDHYYGGDYYAKSVTKPANRSPIVNIIKDGKEHRTTEFFLNSARFIDFIVEKYCRRAGVNVYDFSSGLIVKAKKQNLGEFFK